jgi:SAM-dependent methyltransferase
MEAAGVALPLVQGAAQRVPFADGSFDIVFCDHGAMSFADPRETVPEAARILRPGGLLAFCMISPWLWVAWDWEPDTISDRLHADYFELGPQPVPEGYFEYQLPYGEWIRLARAAGFEVEDLIELRAPEGATSTYDLVDSGWARKWPAEHIWKLRRR